ncbi:MAG TPA: citrate/2-methylcitrate synthase [Candidatus Angelobacter sp.]|nr:citrate/2-methylcitrate synthase [Candidatus Angelobacter sp.]
MSSAHRGSPPGQAHRAESWSTAITATTDERVYVRGVALDEAIGRESFPAMLLRLWRGDAATEDEAELLGACLVASVDHGPLSPSALVVRTIASTRAAPMSGLAGGILAFGELHGAVVSRAMRVLATAPPDGDLDAWATHVFETERAAGRRLPGIGHRWHHSDRRAERLLEVASARSGGRLQDAVRALAARVSQHTGTVVPVNIDGALAVALTSLRLDPAYGDFLFAIARSFGLAAHYVEEQARERPMRTIDPTAADYDGVAIPGFDTQEADE